MTATASTVFAAGYWKIIVLRGAYCIQRKKDHVPVGCNSPQISRLKHSANGRQPLSRTMPSMPSINFSRILTDLHLQRLQANDYLAGIEISGVLDRLRFQ